MSIVLVQNKGIANSSWSHTGTTVNLNSAITAGSALLLYTNGSTVPATVTGGGITTWHQIATVSPSNGGRGSIWYGINSSGGGTSLSFTYGGYDNNLKQVSIAEFSGVQTVETVIDGTAASATGGSVPANSGNTTPTAGNSVLLCGLVVDSDTDTITGITAGFTMLDQASAIDFAPAYQIVSSASGNYHFGCSGTGHGGGGGYMNWGAICAALKAAGGAPANKGFFF